MGDDDRRQRLMNKRIIREELRGIEIKFEIKNRNKKERKLTKNLKGRTIRGVTT